MNRNNNNNVDPYKSAINEANKLYGEANASKTTLRMNRQFDEKRYQNEVIDKLDSAIDKYKTAIRISSQLRTRHQLGTFAEPGEDATYLIAYIADAKSLKLHNIEQEPRQMSRRVIVLQNMEFLKELEYPNPQGFRFSDLDRKIQKSWEDMHRRIIDAGVEGCEFFFKKIKIESTFERKNEKPDSTSGDIISIINLCKAALPTGENDIVSTQSDLRRIFYFEGKAYNLIFSSSFERFLTDVLSSFTVHLDKLEEQGNKKDYNRLKEIYDDVCSSQKDVIEQMKCKNNDRLPVRNPHTSILTVNGIFRKGRIVEILPSGYVDDCASDDDMELSTEPPQSDHTIEHIEQHRGENPKDIPKPNGSLGQCSSGKKPPSDHEADGCEMDTSLTP